jgi:hypothetical protein
LCAGSGVDKDSARIVVDVGRDEPRADDSEKQQEPEFPISQEFHARKQQTESKMAKQTVQNKCRARDLDRRNCDPRNFFFAVM